MRFVACLIGFTIAATNPLNVLAAPPATGAQETSVVCSYAPSQSALVSKIAGAAGGAGLGVEAIMAATGLQAVAHSSGAYILTGGGGYIAGTLGGAIVAPIVVTASIVAAGGAVVLELTCAPANHPEAVAKVREYAEAFERQLRAGGEKLDEVQKASIEVARSMKTKAMAAAEPAKNRLRTATSFAIEYRDAAIGYFQK